MKKLLLTICIYSLLFAPLNSSAKTKLTNEENVSLKALVAEPKKFLNKRIFIEGEFHSFSSLPLDYEKAKRSSEDFIGIILSRPDKKEIPLVELKISVPIKMFKENTVTLNSGDKIRLNSKVYAYELGEPWLEAKDIEILEKAAVVDKEES